MRLICLLNLKFDCENVWHVQQWTLKTIIYSNSFHNSNGLPLLLVLGYGPNDVVVYTRYFDIGVCGSPSTSVSKVVRL